MMRTAAVLLMTLISPLALAHHGGTGTEAAGWSSGLLHPLTGVDHLLAMVAVGMLGARLGGKALWRLPLLFMGLLLAGAVLALKGLVLPYLEQGIVLSVILFGLLVALPRTSAGLGTALVAGFALYHGMAHGVEMPVASAAFACLAGMLVSTGGLHLAGIAAVSRLQVHFARAVGAAVVTGGMLLAVV